MEMTIISRKYGEKIVLIDDEDYDKIKDYKWCVVKESNRFYSMTKIKNKSVKMHRLIMDYPKMVDHINGNGLDNRKSINLRECNHSKNGMNQNKQYNKTTNYKGVSFDKSRNKYKAYLKYNQKYIFLGRFKTEDQAAIAYNIAALKYFGDFARPNVNIMMQK